MTTFIIKHDNVYSVVQSVYEGLYNSSGPKIIKNLPTMEEISRMMEFGKTFDYIPEIPNTKYVHATHKDIVHDELKQYPDLGEALKSYPNQFCYLYDKEWFIIYHETFGKVKKIFSFPLRQQILDTMPDTLT